MSHFLLPKSGRRNDHNNQRFLKYTEELVFIPPDPQESIAMESMLFGEEELDGASGGTYELQRVKEDKYIDKYFEKDTVDNTKSHIFLNSTRIATIKNNDNPYYYNSDHLGSNNLITDSSGNILELSDYLPYGKINYETGSSENEYKYTDKLLDSENNLQYFGARYMDNEIGRFISVDPAVLILHDESELKKIVNGDINTVLSNPQHLNGYAYSLNNPVIMVDDNGEWPMFAYVLASKSNPITFMGSTAASLGFGAYFYGKSVQAFLQGDYKTQQDYTDATMLSLTGAVISGKAMLSEIEAQQAARQNIITGQQITSSSQVPKNVKDVVPKSWGEGVKSDNGGWKWISPNNAGYVRYSTGNPNAKYTTQQTPYVKINDAHGRPLDMHGNVIQGYQNPRTAPEAHIPLDKFDSSNFSF